MSNPFDILMARQINHHGRPLRELRFGSMGSGYQPSSLPTNTATVQ